MTWKFGGDRRDVAAKWHARAWRKVRHLDEVESERHHPDGTLEITFIYKLELECGHVIHKPIMTFNPPDRVICSACEKLS